jgi:phosphate transport system permease protein
MAAITSILAMLVFIFLEVAPLWRSPQVERERTFRTAGGQRLLAADADEYGETLLGVSAAGAVRLVDAFEGRVVAELPIHALEGQPPRLVTRTRDDVFALRADGRLVGLRLGFDISDGGSRHHVEPRVTEVGTWQLPTGDASVRLLAATAPREGNLTVVLVPSGGTPHVFSVIETRNLFGSVHREEAYMELPLDVPGAPTALAVDASGTTAYLGSTDGYLQLWDLRDKAAPRIVGMADATQGVHVPITALGFLNGDRSLVVGDESGGVSVWFPVRDAAGPGGWRLQEVHRFRSHGARVSAVAASPRDRSFLTGDANGQVLLHYATTSRTLLKFAAAGPVDALVYGKKGNGAFGLDAQGDVTRWRIVNPHPEVTLRTLFGRVWYEGYEEPSYTWQSTGATDDFEPKLSLIPLIFGTIKGTLYALLLAVPLAVLAALYTAQFTHPRVRAVVKPTVEIMAALPSVVLGFVAGLWLAPALESRLPGVLLMLIGVPVMLSGFGMAWYTLPRALRSRVGPTCELVIMMLVVVCVAEACLWANDPLERWLFHGDLRLWLRDTAGLRFDQRNCLVVGFAMGFAVIPIIFTISEDALASVPQSLASASLALGATRWQTALRVVLPTASPGIFSAIMIGFGRAIGETMIVLMATGNTPILDWNVFTGMRTLSANIAVEIPEAPYAGTLYRVLFLSALLLFAATFVVNTAAEIVRGRLRRRYQQL